MDLEQNPLDTQSMNLYIPQLQQRGVILGWGSTPPIPPTPTPKPTPLTTPAELTPSPSMPSSTPATTPAPTPTPEKKETPLNIWVIIGPVLGVLAVGGMMYYFLRRRK